MPSPLSTDDAAPDGALVRASLHGDERAFATLVERYRPLIASLVQARLVRPEDVEDEVQETLLLAHSRLPTLARPERFRAWVCRIAVNRAHTSLRRQTRLPVATRDIAALIDGGQPGGAWARRYALPRLMERNALGLAVARLPHCLRAPIVMHVIEDYSYCDIAEALGLPAKVVSRRITQALARLRSATRAAA